MKKKNSVLSRQRTALECSTFPVNPRVFRVPGEWLAAILACSQTHGTHCVHQNTFLKVHPLQNGHLHRCSRSQGIWHHLLEIRWIRKFHETWRRIETKYRKSSKIPTPRFTSVKTTPQKTRFRDVKYGRIGDTEWVDDHSDKNTIDDTKHKINTKHNTKPNNVCSDLNHFGEHVSMRVVLQSS